jgi:hypothetical protein
VSTVSELERGASGQRWKLCRQQLRAVAGWAAKRGAAAAAQLADVRGDALSDAAPQPARAKARPGRLRPLRWGGARRRPSASLGRPVDCPASRLITVRDCWEEGLRQSSVHSCRFTAAAC